MDQAKKLNKNLIQKNWSTSNSFTTIILYEKLHLAHSQYNKLIGHQSTNTTAQQRLSAVLLHEPPLSSSTSYPTIIAHYFILMNWWQGWLGVKGAHQWCLSCMHRH